MRESIYNSEWTKKLEARRHWEYYWQQQKLMENYLATGRKHLLEIGVGSGFTANYLRSKGHTVTTLDIDATKNPDIVADLRNFTSTEQYDAVLAFEVFEHMPFEVFESAARRFSEYVSGRAFVSLPRQCRTLFSTNFYLPILGERSLWVGAPRLKIKIPAHHWEVGHAGKPITDVDQAFEKGSFKLEQRFHYQNQVYSSYAASK